MTSTSFDIPHDPHLRPCLPQGLYTELDFRNEALNAQRMRQLLDESEFKSADVIIPSPYMEYTTRYEGYRGQGSGFRGSCSPGRLGVLHPTALMLVPDARGHCHTAQCAYTTDYPKET